MQILKTEHFISIIRYANVSTHSIFDRIENPSNPTFIGR